MSDDPRIEAVARVLCRSNPNYRTWHMPGDAPRQWKSPGGAVYYTSKLPPESAEVLRNDARAALAAADEVARKNEKEQTK